MTESAPPEPTSPSPTPEVPLELQNQFNSVRMLATAHNLLHQGSFPFRAAGAIQECVLFLKTLHDTALEAASQHPAADLIPELKAAKEMPNAQA